MTWLASHPLAILTEIYIEALLVDEELADQVWEAWDAGEIDDQVAWLAWWTIAERLDVGLCIRIYPLTLSIVTPITNFKLDIV